MRVTCTTRRGTARPSHGEGDERGCGAVGWAQRTCLAIAVWSLRRCGSLRLACAAGAAWTAALLPLPSGMVLVAACAGVLGALLLLWRIAPTGTGARQKHGMPERVRLREQFVRTCALCLLFAALAGLGVSTVLLRSSSASGESTIEALIVTDTAAGPTGMHRASALTRTGGLTLYDRQPLPPAGTVLRVKAEVKHSGPERRAFINATPRVLADPSPPWVLRQDLRTFLRQVAGTQTDGATLLPGLVVGDTSGVSQELTEAMRTTSLAHITAVSGANITLVTLAAMWVMGFVTRRRGVVIPAAVGALVGYVFLVGPDPSVLRAAGMGLLGALVLSRGTGRMGFALLSCAVALLIVLRPELAASAGFALSAAATAALILLSPRLVGVLTRCRTPRWLAMAVAVPVCAQLGVLPVLTAMNSPPGVWAVVLNIAAAPAVPVATGAGLLTLLLGFGTPAVLGTAVPGVQLLAGILVIPGRWCSQWIAWLAHVGSGLPGAQVPWMTGSAGVAAASLVVLAAAIALLSARRTRLIAGVSCVVLLAAGLCAPRLNSGGSLPADWRVLVCAVGQGSATVVRLDSGRVMLVDAGRDVQLLSACLRRVGARSILAVISHFDADHWAGLRAAVQNGGRIERVWVPPGQEAFASRLRAVAGRDGEVLTQGAQLAVAGVTFSVLWPKLGRGGAVSSSPARAAGPATVGSVSESAARNEQALVVRVDCGELSVLIPADVGETEQRQIAAVLQPVDVLLSPHHGSADLSPVLFTRAAAKTGIVSVGENSYGHPTAAALRAFGPVPVLRTDQCGEVWVTDSGAVDSAKGCSAQFSP